MAVQFGANSYPTEFNFADNPIIVNAQWANQDFPEETSFKQIIVEVIASSSYSGAERTFNFYLDASEGVTASVDIASAVRSAMASWQPEAEYINVNQADSYTYETGLFAVKLYTRYMKDGEIYVIAGASRTSTYAFYGGLSEYDLGTTDQHIADKGVESLTFTRKPATGEWKAKGDLISTSGLDKAMVKTEFTVNTDSHISQDETRQFLFVNSLGVFETVTAWCNEALSYNIESQRMNQGQAPSYFSKAKRSIRKTGGRAVLKMSSGHVNREWADWWTTEFLMAKRYWMAMNGRWVPVTIAPSDDELLIYDKAEHQLPHIDFDVELALGGSILGVAR